MNSRQLLFFILVSILALASCKEKNPDYPPVSWSPFFYSQEGIAARAISAVLVPDDHTEWFGSRGTEGILFNEGYGWRSFDATTTGIPFDSITSLLQDGNGLIWAAWKSGLAVYDGNTWNSVPEFTGKMVTSLALQGIGIVWAGIDGSRESGGVARYSNGSWLFMNPLNSDIPSSHITSLLADFDQNLWCCSSDKGVFRQSSGSWRNLTENAEIRSSHFTSLAIDAAGVVWSANTASQLIRFTSSGVTILNTGTGKPVTHLLASGDGKIWMGTSGAGLLAFDGKSWISYSVRNSRLPSDTITALALHPDGRVLAAFPDGHIIIFRKQTE
jgi:ligand-binding sensor domain-containing protein